MPDSPALNTVIAGVTRTASFGIPSRPGDQRSRDRLARLAILICLALCPWIVAADEDYETGRAAYQQGDFARAEEVWRELAEQGDVKSQFFLGVLYDQGGEPVAKDDAQASHWFERAASQGHVSAQFNLGNAYMNGRGVRQDHERAVYWWRKAADNGSPNAQFNLAIQYYQGRGVEKDWDQAVRYFNRAASNGHAKAEELIASNQVPRLPREPASSDAAEQTAAAPSPTEKASRPKPLAESVGEKTDAARSPAESASRGSLEVGGTGWLSAQNPGNYTVQLAASGSEEGLDRLVARHDLADETVRVPTRRDGKILYYLLLGSFADRREANLRIEALPADLRASKPWARPFRELQSLVGESR